MEGPSRGWLVRVELRFSRDPQTGRPYIKPVFGYVEDSRLQNFSFFVTEASAKKLEWFSVASFLLVAIIFVKNLLKYSSTYLMELHFVGKLLDWYKTQQKILAKDIYFSFIYLAFGEKKKFFNLVTRIFKRTTLGSPYDKAIIDSTPPDKRGKLNT